MTPCFQVSLTLQGDAFHPEAFIKTTDLEFATIVSPNVPIDDEIALPWGFATLVAPETETEADKLLWLLNAIQPHRKNFTRFGIETVTVDITGFHDGNPEIRLSPRLLKGLAELGADLRIDFKEDYELRTFSQ